MPKKAHTEEQIVAVLRQGEAGETVADICRKVGLQHLDYGQLLLRRKQREGSDVNYEQLREQSGAIVSPADVTTTDDWVIEEIGRLRASSHVLIDSHALTRESYGFRAIPFSRRQLENLSLDVVIALRCDPHVLIARIELDPGGRRELTTELLRGHLKTGQRWSGQNRPTEVAGD